MPTYKKADKSVAAMANEIIDQFESHHPLLKWQVKIDYLFAFPDLDDDGEPTNDAIKKNGVKALGLCRKLSLKDRAMGRGDAEICLDGQWWEGSSESDCRALLDHELHHLEVKIVNGSVQLDDLQRPKLNLRHHDVDIGWFRIVAERHGAHSMERQQAKRLFDQYGQSFWPGLLCQTNPAK